MKKMFECSICKKPLAGHEVWQDAPFRTPYFCFECKEKASAASRVAMSASSDLLARRASAEDNKELVSSAVGEAKAEPSAAPVCEWEEDGHRCTQPAIYRTHWYWNVCRAHGSILMCNHGINYLVDIPEWERQRALPPVGSERSLANSYSR